MTPSANRTQCPFCLAHPRVKDDGTMYVHDWGRPGVQKRCPGAGKTKEQAKVDKLAGKRDTNPAGRNPSDPEDSIRPEDIF